MEDSTVIEIVSVDISFKARAKLRNPYSILDLEVICRVM